MLQLYAIEILLKLGVGLTLALAPRTAIKLLGLPRAETSFWPRLLGATLIGLAVACYVEARVARGKGLALAGAVSINLIVAAMIALMLLAGATGAATRGRIILWGVVALLVALSVVELAHS